eukprot:135016-Alexandrium_andersonii.AAC.1
MTAACDDATSSARRARDRTQNSHAPRPLIHLDGERQKQGRKASLAGHLQQLPVLDELVALAE